MSSKLDLAPITSVFQIIDSCTNKSQLKTCERLIDVYSELAKKKGVINTDLIKETLGIKLEEKKEEIKLAEKFYVN